MGLEDINSFLEYLESKEHVNDEDMLELIGIFNKEMLSNVDGPNCTDATVCDDNCCSIMIDIPDFLARRYIDLHHLNAKQVRRGDAFSWVLNVDEDTSMCCYFNPRINGCQIYLDDLSLRPPQCAVYPAGYTEGSLGCKSNAGPWVVKNKDIGNACKELMEIYKNYCLNERKRIEEEFISSLSELLDGSFDVDDCDEKPSGIAGVRDTWDGFQILHAEGKSLSFKRFCDELGGIGMQGCKQSYFECDRTCKSAFALFIEFMKETIPVHVKIHGIKENYSLMELLAVVEKE
ncbi:MAG: hypothetical protein ACTSUE_21070 [Promethearchaeota archaeon]